MLVIIVIILLFASLVILHEYGHFIAARRNGVEADEFGIGFPPKLFGRKFGSTLFTFNLLPLGGFVRLKGEDAADRGPGTFGGASYWVKAKILLAGVGMNLLTAIVVLYGLCVTGLPGLGAGLEPGFLKSTYAQPKQLIIGSVSAGSPADKAGIKHGDFILSADGKKLETDTDLRTFTKAHAGKDVSLLVKSGQDEREVSVKLREPGSTEGYLGVVSQQVYKLRYDPLQAVVAALYITGALFIATIVGVFQLIIHIPVLLTGLFSSSVPAAAESASGPLGIIFIMKSVASLGWAYVFVFVANIAVALAAFNVLPLPALDGGRLAVISLQRVLRRQIKAETEAKIHAIGFMALISLMVLITFYDYRKYF